MSAEDEKLVEAVARALADLRIRAVRKWDTDPQRLEAMLPQAVEYCWHDFAPEARAALAVVQPEIDRLREAFWLYVRAANECGNYECNGINTEKCGCAVEARTALAQRAGGPHR